MGVPPVNLEKEVLKLSAWNAECQIINKFPTGPQDQQSLCIPMQEIFNCLGTLCESHQCQTIFEELILCRDSITIIKKRIEKVKSDSSLHDISKEMAEVNQLVEKIQKGILGTKKDNQTSSRKGDSKKEDAVKVIPSATSEKKPVFNSVAFLKAREDQLQLISRLRDKYLIEVKNLKKPEDQAQALLKLQELFALALQKNKPEAKPSTSFTSSLQSSSSSSSFAQSSTSSTSSSRSNFEREVKEKDVKLQNQNASSFASKPSIVFLSKSDKDLAESYSTIDFLIGSKDYSNAVLFLKDLPESKPKDDRLFALAQQSLKSNDHETVKIALSAMSAECRKQFEKQFKTPELNSNYSIASVNGLISKFIIGIGGGLDYIMYAYDAKSKEEAKKRYLDFIESNLIKFNHKEFKGVVNLPSYANPDFFKMINDISVGNGSKSSRDTSKEQETFYNDLAKILVLIIEILPTLSLKDSSEVKNRLIRVFIERHKIALELCKMGISFKESNGPD